MPPRDRPPHPGTTRRVTNSAGDQLHHRPGGGYSREPGEAGEAVDVDGADRDDGCRDEAEGEVPPGAAALTEGQDEGEDEEGLDRLLEGALGVVGGDEVREADHECRGGATERRLVGESRQGGQRGEDRRGDRQAVEAL